MRTTGTVVEVSKEHIQRIVVVLARRDRDRGFVTTETKWDEHSTLAVRHLCGDYVLADIGR